jgi:hypothetical protein
MVKCWVTTIVLCKEKLFPKKLRHWKPFYFLIFHRNESLCSSNILLFIYKVGNWSTFLRLDGSLIEVYDSYILLDVSTWPSAEPLETDNSVVGEMLCQAETIQVVVVIVCLVTSFVDLHLQNISVLQVFASVECLLSNVGLSTPGFNRQVVQVFGPQIWSCMS